MIVRAKSAHFLFLPKEDDKTSEWVNLANVEWIEETPGQKLVVSFVSDDIYRVYEGAQAETIKEELTRICSEQVS